MARDRLVAEDCRVFFVDAEPRLRRALVAGFGVVAGREAAAEALSWGWEHWERLREMENPVGYLYRVGQTAARRRRERDGRQAMSALVELADLAVFERDPSVFDLGAALGSLSVQQQTSVVLVHGFGYSLRETAEVMEVSVATVREHVARALARLRVVLEDDRGSPTR